MEQEKTFENSWALPTLFKKGRHTLELIKFSHTIFAMPFALVAYFVATGGALKPWLLFWVLIGLVSARTAAMAFNRLADHQWDAKNPRTQGRHLPQGLLSRGYVIGLTVLASLIFILAAAQLNRLALILSPVCLVILFFYSLTKRFTHFTQFFLGLALGMAPVGTTIAVTGQITISSLVLGLGVLFWVAGFDLLYSLQDLSFDQKEGLYSLAKLLGLKKSFWAARLFHIIFLICLVAYGSLVGLGYLYWGGLALWAGLIIWEHWQLGEDLKNLQASFFTANGLLSLLFLALTLTDIFLLD